MFRCSDAAGEKRAAAIGGTGIQKSVSRDIGNDQADRAAVAFFIGQDRFCHCGCGDVGVVRKREFGQERLQHRRKRCFDEPCVFCGAGDDTHTCGDGPTVGDGIV